VVTGREYDIKRAQAARQAPLITDARTPASKELATRQKRYAITMAFRTACFVAMIFVPGPLRWVLFACAVSLPYIAVVLANQAHTKGMSSTVSGPEPSDAPQLTTGHDDITSGDVHSRHDSLADRDERVA
jgi:hypothetical protein